MKLWRRREDRWFGDVRLCSLLHHGLMWGKVTFDIVEAVLWFLLEPSMSTLVTSPSLPSEAFVINLPLVARCGIDAKLREDVEAPFSIS